jgi:hypothetical protein
MSRFFEKQHVFLKTRRFQCRVGLPSIDQLCAMTRELADILRNNRTIDWQKKRMSAPKCEKRSSNF